MVGTEDPIRISQSALNKAGALGLDESVRQGETLSGLLKYMVEQSALATGRTRHAKKDGAKRRRYGDVILMLRGHTVVDLAVLKQNYCKQCLGVEPGDCTC